MNEIFKFKLGAFRCMAVNDGDFSATAEMLFANAPADELVLVLKRYGENSAKFLSPLTCLLVDIGQQKILIDVGMGRASEATGKLRPLLQQEGIAAADIDIVVLTHIHNDHTLGCIDEKGELAFPNARFVLGKDEWDFWSNEANLQKAPQWVADTARAVLPLLEGRIDLLEGRAVVVPGIELLPAPGHTYGHAVVEVASQGQRLLFLSDLALHPIHIEYPYWTAVLDQFPERAIQARRAFFDYAAATGALVTIFHFNPFPGLGYLAKEGDSYRWMKADITNFYW